VKKSGTACRDCGETKDRKFRHRCHRFDLDRTKGTEIEAITKGRTEGQKAKLPGEFVT